MTKRRKLGVDPRIPIVEAYLRRMQGGGDDFDKLIARIRARDGPFIHAAKPKVVDGEDDEDVADVVDDMDDVDEEP